MSSKVRLKEELQMTLDLTAVVEVMKQVSATHLHRLEKLQVRFDLFSQSLQDFFYWMGMTKVINHPFFKNSVEARLIVMITSDAGFLGGLNTNIIAEGFAHYKKERQDGLAVIGDRGRNFLQDLGFPLEGSFPGISTNIEKQEIRDVKKLIAEKILEGRYGGAWVIYPHYYSIGRQAIGQLELFPCKALPEEKGSLLGPLRTPNISLEDQFFVESSTDKMIGYLAELWTSDRLYNLFWHSKLSELAARTMHLEESFQELGTEKKKLAFLYSRCVHEETDRNIREIVASRGVKREDRGQKTESSWQRIEGEEGEI